LLYAGHGWASPDPGETSNPEGPGLPGGTVAGDDNGNGIYGTGEGSKYGLTTYGRELKDLRSEVASKSIVFESKCLIEIHSCRVSVAFATELAGITGCRVVAAHSGVSPYKGDENAWKSGPHDPHEAKVAADPSSGWPTGWYEVVPSTSGGPPKVVEKNSIYKPKY
jgi:hypothetical protein